MKPKELHHIRNEYSKFSLDEKSIGLNPIEQFKSWLDQALDNEVIKEASSFVLSTSFGDGRVSSRVLLLKYFDEDGFVFFTNYNSKKALQIKENNKASILFYWPELERQTRIEGMVEKTSGTVSNEYFSKKT